MSRHRLHALAAMALLLVAGNAAADDTIRCESQGGQYQSCPANTSGGVYLSRQLSSQGCWQNDTWGYDRNRVWVTRGCRAEFRVGSSRSNNNDAKIAGALVLGTIAAVAIANSRKHDERRRDNYDDDRYNRRYGNDYDYGYDNGSSGGGYGSGREFTCSSKDGRTAWCGGSIGYRDHVEVRRQLSDSPCVYGRSWGVDRSQVWVSNGCRAVFVTY